MRRFCLEPTIYVFMKKERKMSIRKSVLSSAMYFSQYLEGWSMGQANSVDFDPAAWTHILNWVLTSCICHRIISAWTGSSRLDWFSPFLFTSILIFFFFFLFFFFFSFCFKFLQLSFICTHSVRCYILVESVMCRCIVSS